MKYIITDMDEARVGGAFHSDMAVGLKGKVIAAGHCFRNEDGTYRVWGSSIGYGIDAKREDAKKLEEIICKTCLGTGEVSTREPVYRGEPHMADIGMARCPDCTIIKEPTEE